MSKTTHNLRREESHFAKVKTSCGVCLSVISTFTGTCEISSATVCSECHPIPNQMTDAGCHKNDRSRDSNRQQAPGRGLSVSGMSGTLQPSEATLPAPSEEEKWSQLDFARVNAPSRVWGRQGFTHSLSSGSWVSLLETGLNLGISHLSQGSNRPGR